jgi:hypothetical protein
MIELMTQIMNLKDLLAHSIRINEKDISRRIREEIGSRERELRTIKVQIEQREAQKNSQSQAGLQNDSQDLEITKKPA